MEGVSIGISFFSLTFLLFVFGCASQSAPQQTVARNVPIANYGQVQTVNREVPVTYSRSEQLDSVIREASDYVISKLPIKSRIGVVNMNSSSVNLSNYVIDSIVMHLVNRDNFVVIERSELDTVQKEQKYQLSGEVSDETAVSIGKQLGTQMIVTGSILPFGSDYSLRLKITDVQTAQIIGTRIFTVKPDNVLLSLLKPTVEEPKIAQQTVIMGDINITNNNTTTIQGDVYVNMPKGLGW
jgi:hypothetical protein